MHDSASAYKSVADHKARHDAHSKRNCNRSVLLHLFLESHVLNPGKIRPESAGSCCMHAMLTLHSEVWQICESIRIMLDKCNILKFLNFFLCQDEYDYTAKHQAALRERLKNTG